MNGGDIRAFSRETVQGRGVGEGKVTPEIGGSGAYAHVRVAVEALSRGRGNIFSWDAGSVIPARFAAAVVRGIDDVVRGGVLAGFELVDVHVSVKDGSYHEEDSSSDAFREAAREALTQALQEAGPLILEAYSTVRAIVPATLSAAVQAVMGSQSGEAVQSETRFHAITANTPAAQVDGLIRNLLAVTGGVGQITYSHGGFRLATEPPDIVEVRVPLR